MTFAELRKKEGKISGLVALERVLPIRTSAWLKKFLLIAVPFLMVMILALNEQSLVRIEFLYGILLLDIALLLTVFMLDCFYYSHYFDGVHLSTLEWGIRKEKDAVPYEVLEIVSHTHAGDIVGGFFASIAGHDIFARLGVHEREIRSFLSSDRQRIYTESVTIGEPVTLTTYTAALLAADKKFADFIEAQGVSSDDLLAAATWVAAIAERKKEMYRWWGRDALGRIKGLYKHSHWTKISLSALDQFGKAAVPRDEEIVFKKEIDEVEKVLAHDPHSNAVLVAPEYRQLQAIVSGLANRIQDGSVLPPLQHKKIIILDSLAIDHAASVPGRFESIVIQVLNKATENGHIILAIKNLPYFFIAARKRDIDIETILARYLESSAIQIIGLAVKEGFAELLAGRHTFLKSFKQILVEGESRKVIIRALTDRAFFIERRLGVFFTYQGLNAITNRAHATAKAEDVENRAMEIFEEVIPKIVQSGAKAQKNRKKPGQAQVITAQDIEAHFV